MIKIVLLGESGYVLRNISVITLNEFLSGVFHIANY